MESEQSQQTTQGKAFSDRKRKQNNNETFNKRSCEDGFSWWTSMMLGVQPTRQQAHSRVNVRSVKY